MVVAPRGSLLPVTGEYLEVLAPAVLRSGPDWTREDVGFFFPRPPLTWAYDGPPFLPLVADAIALSIVSQLSENYLQYYKGVELDS